VSIDGDTTPRISSPIVGLGGANPAPVPPPIPRLEPGTTADPFAAPFAADPFAAPFAAEPFAAPFAADPFAAPFAADPEPFAAEPFAAEPRPGSRSVFVSSSTPFGGAIASSDESRLSRASNPAYDALPGRIGPKWIAPVLSITTNDAAVATTCACAPSTVGNVTGIGPRGNELVGAFWVGVFWVGVVLGVDELGVPLGALPLAELLLGASREPHANNTTTRESARITSRRYH